MRSAVENFVREGLAHHQAGRLEEAHHLYNQALALDARHPDALHLAGMLALQSGDSGRAVDLIRRATAVQPRNWMFQANLASALLQIGDHAGATVAFRAAVKVNPDDPQLQIAAANCIALGGDFAAAEAQLRKIVRRFPGSALAWFNLGNAVRDQRRYAEAVPLFTRATQLDTTFADAHNNLGSSLHSLQRFSEAENAYRAAIALRPGDTTAYCNLASVLIDAGKFGEGEAACRKALAIDADCVPAHSALAAALSSQGRLVEALPVYRRVAELTPQDAQKLAALGSALFEAGNASEGITLLERAAQLQPDAPAVQQGLAWAYLASGDFQRGWRAYCQRPRRERFVAKHAHFALATELPADLHGRTVCLLREQGLGDELFFARYVPRLSARGARVLYSADARLVGMLQRTGRFENVAAHTDDLPAADFHVLVGDLPHALAAHEASAESAYAPAAPLALTPLPDALEALGTRLAALGPAPYIGVTWRAGIAPEDHRGANWAFYKHVTLAALAASLRDAPGTVLALQRAPRAGEIDELSRCLGRTAHDLSALNSDLEAMLALLALIDDYIGVSNTNMHLRAGLGRPARVLVPCPGEWRWLERDHQPVWFPGFLIYRQESNGDWSAALDALRRDLEASHGATS